MIPNLGGKPHEDVFVNEVAKLGSKVHKGDVLAEVDTVKASAEIEAPVSGVVVKVCLKRGATAHVGDTIAVIGPSLKAKPKAHC